MLYKTKLTKIGNSRGVRIPHQVIEELGLGGDVEMIVEDDRIILQATRPVREGWEAAFAKMSESGDDDLLDGEIDSRFDDQEWTW